MLDTILTWDLPEERLDNCLRSLLMNYIAHKDTLRNEPNCEQRLRLKKKDESRTGGRGSGEIQLLAK